MLFAALAFAVAGGIVYAFTGSESNTTVSTAVAAQDNEPSTKLPQTQTGLPLPRFVSLKSERVNVRRGPSNEHSVAWVFTRKALPVEIVAEYDHWRRIRDSEGAEGWVYHSLLSGRRTVIAAPWANGAAIDLHSAAKASSSLVAKVSSGAVGSLNSCDGKWCSAEFGSYQGYIPQERLFGVYPNETYDK
jgi:SH3-like domain-containing protein